MHEQDSWNKEKRSAYLYRIISDMESGSARQLLFLELAKEADNQAALWLSELKKYGITPPAKYNPGLHVSILAWLIKKLGARKLKTLLTVFGMRGLSVYAGRDAQGVPPPAAADEATRHPAEVSELLRSAGFGINDGLISMACLVLGVAAAYREYSIILLVGVGGLLAGAISMAVGEFISMREPSEVADDLATEEPTRHDPSPEADELTRIYLARGLSKRDARIQAWRMIEDLDLDEAPPAQRPRAQRLPASPWVAALSSFFAFVGGGIIPLLPYLLDAHRHPLLISMVLTTLSLYGIGAALSEFTGRGPLWGGLRMLLIYAAAGTTAYLIGNLFAA